MMDIRVVVHCYSFHKPWEPGSQASNGVCVGCKTVRYNRTLSSALGSEVTPVWWTLSLDGNVECLVAVEKLIVSTPREVNAKDIERKGRLPRTAICRARETASEEVQGLESASPVHHVALAFGIPSHR